MDISVVVPVYNPPHHLFEENIKSLISQCGDFEFIYINDGSTDEWIDKRLQNLAETDSRIVYVRKQNSGVSDTRNVGIDMAKGDYIMFVDSDDALAKDSLNYALDTIRFFKADIVIFGINQGPHDIHIRKLLNSKEQKHLKLSTLAFRTSDYYDIGVNVDGPCAKLFKQSLINDNNLKYKIDICKSEDAIFDLYAYEYANKIAIDNRLIYYYAYNESSISNRYVYKHAKMIPLYLDEEKKFIEKYHTYEEDYWDALATRAITGIADADHRYFAKTQPNKSILVLAREFSKILSAPVVQKCLGRLSYSKLSNIQMPGMSNKIKLFFYKHKLTFLDLFIHKILK